MIDVHLPVGTLHDPCYFGVLVPAPSGVRYHVQLGGHICEHASLEGVYIPLLPGDLGAFEEGPDATGAGSLSSEAQMSRKDVHGLWSGRLARLPAGAFRPPTENEIVDFVRENPEADFIGEAWLPVVVTQKDERGSDLADLIAGFRGRMVVIVWGNSD